MLAAVTLGGVALAQDVPPPVSAGEDARDALRRGDYMAARAVLEKATASAGKRDDQAEVMGRQITPMLTGELPLDGLSRGRAAAVPDPANAAKVRNAVARPAIAEIVHRARETSVVILNEAHYSPRDRALALEVARALRPLGYS